MAPVHGAVVAYENGTWWIVPETGGRPIGFSESTLPEPDLAIGTRVRYEIRESTTGTLAVNVELL
jgi:cold shock CspA family protein